MVRKLKKAGLVAALVGVSLMMGSCGQKGTEGAGSAGTAKETPVAGGSEKQYKDEISIAVTAQPPTLDTAITASGLAVNIGGNIFEQLVTLNDKYEPVMDLAESVDVSDDGLVYTFTLRQNIKFHNGKEMTADDVVASMNRWATTSSRAKSLLTNAVFEKVDDYTVTLTVEKATSDVLIVLGTRAQFPAILPKEVVDAAPAEGISEYIGTGPYKLQEWKQDQYIHLVKYDEYQSRTEEPSAYSGRREAATPNLYYYFVSDHATRIAGIKTGEYDVAESIPLESYDELAGEDGVTMYARSMGSLNLFFNTSEGLLKDIKYREAILAALDMEEIMLGSYADPKNFTLDPGYMNIKQPQWATKAGEEYYNQANVEKAKQLLEEAGYNGETVTLLTTKDYQEMYAAVIVIQEQLRQAGINAEVANFDFPTFMDTKNDRSKWDLFVTSNAYNLTPPQILAVNKDWAGFEHETLTKYLGEIRGAKTQEEAKEAWEGLQLFMYEYVSSTTLGHYNSSMATTTSVEGFEYFDQPIYWNAKVAK